MVRSDENQPIRAMLWMVLAYQSGAVAPERVDIALRRGIGIEIGGDHEPVVLVEAVDQLAIAVGSSGENTPEAIADSACASSGDPSITARGS